MNMKKIFPISSMALAILFAACSLGGDIDAWRGLVEKKPAGEKATSGLAFTLTFNEDSYSVGRGTETAANVVIPVEYNGLPVTEIAAFGFYNYTGLKSITIPDSVINIDNSAFNNCSGLTSIILPGSVTWIGASVFAGCSVLMSILIPDSVTQIDTGAFYNCGSLSKVFYGGTDISAWSNIHIGTANDPLTSSIIYYYSPEPITDGSHWYFAGGAPTVWN